MEISHYPVLRRSFNEKFWRPLNNLIRWILFSEFFNLSCFLICDEELNEKLKKQLTAYEQKF